MIGNDEVISSGRNDFQATLAKEKSLGSRSDREEEPQTAALNPKLDLEGQTTPSLMHAPNNAESDVIQEIDEGSSHASKSKRSVHKLYNHTRVESA